MNIYFILLIVVLLIAIIWFCYIYVNRKRKTMIERAAIICYSTQNYDKLARKLIASLYQNKVPPENILHKVESIDFTGKDGFRSTVWYNAILNKVVHLVDSLKEFTNPHYRYAEIEYFIFCDCDVFFYSKNRECWDEVEDYMKLIHADIFFMREGESHVEVNTGFYIIKRNENLEEIIQFFEKVIEFMKLNMHKKSGEDQIVINELKSNIKWDFFPNKYMCTAENCYDTNATLLQHAICSKNIDEKIEQIKRVHEKLGVHYLTDKEEEELLHK